MLLFRDPAPHRRAEVAAASHRRRQFPGDQLARRRQPLLDPVPDPLRLDDQLLHVGGIEVVATGRLLSERFFSG